MEPGDVGGLGGEIGVEDVDGLLDLLVVEVEGEVGEVVLEFGGAGGLLGPGFAEVGGDVGGEVVVGELLHVEFLPAPFALPGGRIGGELFGEVIGHGVVGVVGGIVEELADIGHVGGAELVEVGLAGAWRDGSGEGAEAVGGGLFEEEGVGSDDEVAGGRGGRGCGDGGGGGGGDGGWGMLGVGEGGGPEGDGGGGSGEEGGEFHGGSGKGFGGYGGECGGGGGGRGGEGGEEGGRGAARGFGGECGGEGGGGDGEAAVGEEGADFFEAAEGAFAGGGGGDGEVGGGLFDGFVLEVAEEDGGAFGGREFGEGFIEEGGEGGEVGVGRGGLGGHGGTCEAFVVFAAAAEFASVEGAVAGGFVKPGGEGVLFAEGVGFAGEEEEDGLGDVVGILGGEAMGGGVDEVGVAAGEFGEGGGVLAFVEELREEGGVGEGSGVGVWHHGDNVRCGGGADMLSDFFSEEGRAYWPVEVRPAGRHGRGAHATCASFMGRGFVLEGRGNFEEAW